MMPYHSQHKSRDLHLALDLPTPFRAVHPAGPFTPTNIRRWTTAAPFTARRRSAPCPNLNLYSPDPCTASPVQLKLASPHLTREVFHCYHFQPLLSRDHLRRSLWPRKTRREGGAPVYQRALCLALDKCCPCHVPTQPSWGVVLVTQGPGLYPSNLQLLRM